MFDDEILCDDEICLMDAMNLSSLRINRKIEIKNEMEANWDTLLN